MAWYDCFSRFYDATLEPHYREQRLLAAEALALEPDSVVLDLPCGTGQGFDAVLARLGPAGRVVGVDLSRGMLRQARDRVARHRWERVTLREGDAVDLADVRYDRLLVFLGMSVFPDPRAAFANLWSLLEPGGRCVIVDVHAETLGLQGRMVNLLAGADITRRSWELLADVCEDFERRELPSKPLHGGQLWLATGRKAR